MSEPENKLPIRKTLAHPAPYVRVNRTTIVFLTICTQNRDPILATDQFHNLLLETWQGATAWLVGHYVVMPDHIHLFVGPGSPSLPLANWVRFVKSQFAKRLGRAIWQSDYWDTMLRSGDSYQSKWKYVRENPVRAGLVKTHEEWPYLGELNHLSW